MTQGTPSGHSETYQLAHTKELLRMAQETIKVLDARNNILGDELISTGYTQEDIDLLLKEGE